MTEPALGRAEELFLELADLEPAARMEQLALRRQSDPELADEVAALLGCHDRADDFLKSGDLRAATAELEGTLPPNSRLADYTILGVLGVGGMGVVYIAEQERPRRTVALKLIRRGLGGKSMLRRFEHEAEVLGRLQHPGIAQIYEAGAAETGGGLQPFIAMELIRGLPLREYANKNGLDAAARLGLVARVCDAVQHAHQRGFIHRDLKPANILVNEEGDPKVLDFGIARATDADLQINTLHTDVGQLVGTLPYMSPEQFSGDPEEIDTRADVYALGVILHELLADSLPFEVRGRSIAEIATMVREQDPPRIGTIDRSLRGDVETIVLKALEKDKSRRYQSAAELGADIRRFIAGEPIEAKRDSAMYILRKQIRRYRGVAAAIGTSLVALLVFSVVVSIQLQRNWTLARAEAEAKTDALASLEAARAAERLAEERAVELREQLTASSLEQGRLLSRAGNLAAAEDLIWPVFLTEPGLPHAYWGLWELYWRLPCAASIAAHDDRIGGIALIGDGATFATGGVDGAVKVWDTRQHRLLRTLQGPPVAIVALAASPTEPRIAAGFADGSIVVWDSQSGDMLRTIPGAVSPRGLAFSPDGAFFAAGNRDGVLRVFSPSGDGPLRETASVGEQLWRVTVGPGGVIAATPPERPLLYMWTPDATEPRVLRELDSWVSASAFSPDGRTLATSGSDRLIHLWDMQTFEHIAAFGGRNGSIMTLAFSDDSNTLLSSGYWAVEIWDVPRRERRLTLPSHMAVPTAAMSRDTRCIIAATEDGLVRVWDTRPDVGVTRLAAHKGRTAAEVSPDGRLVATGDEAGKLRLWEMDTGSLLAEIDAHAARIKSIHFQPGGTLLATVGDDYRIKVWDLATGRSILTEENCASVSTWSCAFSSDGSKLAFALGDGAIRVLDMPACTVATVIPSNRRQVVSVRFTPDNSALVSIDRSRTIHVWGVDGSPLEPFELPAIQPWTVAFSPDGRTLLVGSWARTVELYDVVTRKRTAELRGHNALVSRVESGPGGQLAVSSGNDGALRLWHIPSRRPLASMEFFEGWDVTTASLAPDGRRIVAGGADGSVVIIDPSAVERFIAANAAHQIARFRARGEEFPKTAQVEAWAAGILSGSAAPILAATPSETTGATPEVIRAWAARPRP